MKALSLSNLILSALLLFIFPIFLGLLIAMGIVVSNNYDSINPQNLWISSLVLIILTSITGVVLFTISFIKDIITIVIICLEWEKNRKPAVILLISLFILGCILGLIGSGKLVKHYFSKKNVAEKELKNASL